MESGPRRGDPNPRHQSLRRRPRVVGANLVAPIDNVEVVRAFLISLGRLDFWCGASLGGAIQNVETGSREKDKARKEGDKDELMQSKRANPNIDIRQWRLGGVVATYPRDFSGGVLPAALCFVRTGCEKLRFVEERQKFSSAS